MKKVIHFGLKAATLGSVLLAGFAVVPAHASLKEAIDNVYAKAKAENKRVILHFTEGNLGQKSALLDAAVFENAAIVNSLSNDHLIVKVPVRFKADAPAEDRATATAIAKKYKVTLEFVPSYFVTSADGALYGTVPYVETLKPEQHAELVKGLNKVYEKIESQVNNSKWAESTTAEDRIQKLRACLELVMQYSNGRLVGHQKLIDEFKAADPKNEKGAYEQIELLNLLSSLEANDNEPGKALIAIDNFLSIPNLSAGMKRTVLVLKSTIYASSKDIAKAVEAIDQAIQVDPNFIGNEKLVKVKEAYKALEEELKERQSVGGK